MKTKFTLKTLSIFALIFIMAASLKLNGQTTYNVAVTNYAFTQSQLTITAGDKVIWTNNAGSHNVNGTQSAFPNNPASFGNNVGSGWTYEFVFNTAGTYDYQCDPHAGMGMIGKIIVNPKVPTSSKTLADGPDNVRLFPNPATENIELYVPGSFGTVTSLKVYSISGKLISQKAFSGNLESPRLDVSNFKSGIYFVEINSSNKEDVLKFIKQ